MISKQKLEELKPILSAREIEVVRKRLQNKPISQTESNYLSRSVREKLRAAEFVVKIGLRSLLEYRRKKYERKIKLLKEKIIKSLGNLKKEVKAIALYGSYVRNAHINYNDIDVMIVLKKKIWKNPAGKNKLEREIEARSGLKLDVQLIVYKDLIKVFFYSPLLQTELRDKKIIYGNLKLPSGVIVDKDYLYGKLLEVENVLELGKEISSRYIYNALRTCLSIKLFLGNKVGNELIVEEIKNNIGEVTLTKLREGDGNFVQVEIALKYLKFLYKKLEKELNE